VRGVVDCLLVDDEKRRECRCRRLQRVVRNAKMAASAPSLEICRPFREVIADPAKWEGLKESTVPIRASKKTGARMDAILFAMVIETDHRSAAEEANFEELPQNSFVSEDSLKFRGLFSISWC
jgi:hypothetical protein